MSKEKLTRDSDVYNKNIRNKVINNTSFESQIEKLSFTDLSLNYKWVSKWSNLKEKGIEKNMSVSYYKKIQNYTPSKRSSKLNNNVSFHDWTIKKKDTQTQLIITVQGKFVLPDGSNINGKQSIVIESFSDFMEIKELCNYEDKDKNVTINIKSDDKFNLKTKKQTYDFNTINKITNNKSNTKILKQIISYSENESNWVNAKITKLKHDNENIYLHIGFDYNTKYNDVEIVFPFDASETDNGLWKLTLSFNYEDPLMLEGESVYLCFEPFTNDKGLVKNELWLLDSEPKSKNNIYSSLINYIKKYI